jgi:CRISPR-associated endonuclease Csn1
LVYVPEENENIKAIDWTNTSKVFDKVYKMVSCSGTECYFLPHNTANLLLPYNAQTKKGEFGSLNKTENTINGISIKRNCVKIKTDRLGNIIYPVKVSLLDSPGESFADIPTNQPVKD